jgi:hypothetical protein
MVKADTNSRLSVSIVVSLAGRLRRDMVQEIKPNPGSPRLMAALMADAVGLFIFNLFVPPSAIVLNNPQHVA